MKSKVHVIWVTNDQFNRLTVGFADSEDRIKESASRYYRPGEKSAERLQRILNRSGEVPFLCLHDSGPSVTYYLPRRPRNPAPAPKRALALVA